MTSFNRSLLRIKMKLWILESKIIKKKNKVNDFDLTYIGKYEDRVMKSLKYSENCSVIFSYDDNSFYQSKKFYKDEILSCGFTLIEDMMAGSIHYIYNSVTGEIYRAFVKSNMNILAIKFYYIQDFSALLVQFYNEPNHLYEVGKCLHVVKLRRCYAFINPVLFSDSGCEIKDLFDLFLLQSEEIETVREKIINSIE